jgi:hypothetical protein
MSARRRQISLSWGAVLVALACTSLAACGDGSSDSKLLSPTDASELRSTLAQVEQQVENGDCTAAREQVSLLERQVSSLDRIEADLRDALTSGTSRLQELVTANCPQAPATETGTTGTTDTGGTSAPDEQQTDEPGNSEGKGKGKKKGHFKDEGNDGQSDEGAGSDEQSGGSGGTTGSGGFAP